MASSGLNLDFGEMNKWPCIAFPVAFTLVELLVD